MGIIQAASDSVRGTLADQWKEVFTAGPFGEHAVLVPGILKNRAAGRGSNAYGTQGVISNGSRIFVPENTVACIYSEGEIEEMIFEPGNYEYTDGEESMFSGDGVGSLIGQVASRIGFGGVPAMDKRVSFVNMREIRHIPFGTRGPQMYNDGYYHCDLEVHAYGNFSIQVTDPYVFLRNFVPPNAHFYTFDDTSARKQILSEFLQSFIVALNRLSNEFRISQLPSQARVVAERVAADEAYVGSWPKRFGFELKRVAVESIEFSDESRELVHGFNRKRMEVNAFEGVSQHAANIAAQQRIAQGVQENGLGEGGGMLFGMNLASALSSSGVVTSGSEARSDSASAVGSPIGGDLDDCIEAVKKLKELLDLGALTQDEFDAKKREVLNL